MLENRIENKRRLTEKLREFFVYTGWALGAIFGVVYIVVLVIVIYGFKADVQFETMLLLSILGALFTFAISVSFMQQGVLFAKEMDDNKAVMLEYTNLMNKKKKEEDTH